MSYTAESKTTCTLAEGSKMRYRWPAHYHAECSGAITGPYIGAREDCLTSWDRVEAARAEAAGWKREAPPMVPSGE